MLAQSLPRLRYIMTRLFIIGIALAIALTIFALVDVIFIDRFRVRGIPKGLWIVVIIFIPVVGPILWLTVGRGPKGKGPRRTIAPDDDPDFLRGLNFPPPGDKS